MPFNPLRLCLVTALLLGVSLAQLVIQTDCAGLSKKNCKKKKGQCQFKQGSCKLKMNGGGGGRRGGGRRGGRGNNGNGGNNDDDGEKAGCAQHSKKGKCRRAADCSWKNNACVASEDVESDSSSSSDDGDNNGGNGGNGENGGDKCAKFKSSQQCYSKGDCSWVGGKCKSTFEDSEDQRVEEPIVDKSLAGSGYCVEASEERDETVWFATEAECRARNQPYCTYNCEEEKWAASRTCTKKKSKCGSRVVAQDINGPLKVSAEEWQGFKLLNKMRAQGYQCPGSALYGSVKYKPNKKKLVFDCDLWRAAYKHSQDMASRGYFEHNSPDGRGFVERAVREGTTADGENIASGYFRASEVLNQFRGSMSGHCNNMMNSDHKRFAIGYGTANGGHKWTQLFSTECFKYDYNENRSCTPDEHYDTSCYPEGESG